MRLRFLGRRLERRRQDRRCRAKGFLTASFRIVTQPPLRSRHRALDHDEAALGVGLDNLKVLRRHADGAHVASHLLALEHLAGILALAGRAMRAVR
jgi:hypothetical protein